MFRPCWICRTLSTKYIVQPTYVSVPYCNEAIFGYLSQGFCCSVCREGILHCRICKPYWRMGRKWFPQGSDLPRSSSKLISNLWTSLKCAILCHWWWCVNLTLPFPDTFPLLGSLTRPFHVAHQCHSGAGETQCSGGGNLLLDALHCLRSWA